MKLKLKPVVASLVLLGLMAPAFAHDHRAKTIASQDAVVNQNSFINEVCEEGWFNRVKVGGAVGAVGMWGNTNLPGMFAPHSDSSVFDINNINLFVDAAFSKWAKATVNLAYLGAPDAFSRKNDNTISTKIDNRIFVDEAYVIFSDFAKNPLYAKIGKTYVPFGEYNDQVVPWQVESPAQMISMTNGPTAIVGVASDFGFYASIFGLQGDTTPFNSSSNNIRNFGGKIGYQDNLARFESPNTNFNVNLSYIRNIWDSQFFTSNNDSPWGVSNTGSTNQQRDAVGGLGVHIDMSYMAFSAYADWVGALKNMAPAYSIDPLYSVYSNSSKFWGANVNAAYAFETLSHGSSVAAGVQFSGNGQWFASNKVSTTATDGGGLYAYLIPKWRGLVEYKVNLVKHTDLSLMYAHSKSYDFTVDNNSRHTNVGLARLGFRF